MVNESVENQIKVCRNCHTIYKKVSHKSCGNNCQFSPPFFINNKPNTEIEPSDVLIKASADKKIRWLCLQCHTEYNHEEINGRAFKCKSCKTENDVYPFAIKSCANCIVDNKNHELPIDAKSCERCGKTDFILNNEKKVSELKKIKLSKEKEDEWDGPETVIFHPPAQEKPKNTNIMSLTLTILNCNMEIQLYGENKTLTLTEIIRNANGYIPDTIYERLLQKYPKELLIFKFSDNQFSLESPMELFFAELDLKYQKKSIPEKWDSQKQNTLPESKLLEFKGDFLKFLIYVY
jgi:hypothetical protein